MADRSRARADDLTSGLVRAALIVRLASLIVLLLVPVSDALSVPVLVSVALVAGWSLFFLAVRHWAVAVAGRHPLFVLADVVLAVAVTVLVGPHSPLILVVLSTALLIGVLLPRLYAALVTANLVLGYLLAVIVATQLAYPLFTTVLPVTFVVIAYLGNLTQRLHRQVLAEQRHSAELAAAAATDAERSRLAREMHDSVAKTLHGVALAASALPQWIERDAARAAQGAADLQHAAEQASVEARALLVDLRRDPDDTPLADLLRRRLDDVAARADIVTDLRVDGLVEPPPGTRHQVARVVTEALENVVRHSGATRVDVVAGTADDLLEVTVEDDGHGFRTSTVPAGRFGIRGMRERLETVGGILQVQSTPGHGTRVRLRVPSAEPAVVEVSP